MIIFWICALLFAIFLEGVAMYGYLNGNLTGQVTVNATLNIVVMIGIAVYWICKHTGTI